MRLAIVATPPCASLALVSILTASLALRPHPARPAPPPPPRSVHVSHCPATSPLLPPQLTCEQAHTLRVRGWVTGGPSHLRLAGPVLATDVTTDASGEFSLVVPVDGNVCDLVREPSAYTFDDGSMHVVYAIDFAR